MEILNVGNSKLYKIEVGASTYLFRAKGARLLNWYLSMADGYIRDVIHMPSNFDMTLGDFSKLRGGNPILFPFAGASWADGKKGFWKTPTGDTLPMRMHGYALDGDFDIIEMSDTALRAIFKPCDEAKIAYPYDYEFTVTYRFSELSFNCELMLKNNGSEKIPWGAGLHPYFQLPWHSGTTRKDYRLLCDAKKAYHINDDGTFIPADTSQNCFADEDIYNRIHTKLKTNVVKFGTKNGEEDITMKIGFEDSSNIATTIVTWSENDDAKYYCVEPWMNMPNSASKPVHFVDAGKSKSFVVDISLM